MVYPANISNMKRKLFGLGIVAILSVFCASFLQNIAYADVNDFSFSSFKADYYLSKDSEGRSTMKVVEVLTAEFPDSDQNKGIIRSIPDIYDGHSTSFKLISLTRNGQTEPIYSQYRQNGNVVIETGTDDYVHGTQKYIFTYSLNDVTKDFNDHQELYWDTNGTGWSQKFDMLSVNIHLDDSIKSSFNNSTACYQGAQDSTEKCGSGAVEGNIITFTASRQLQPGENLTFVIGFKANTFAGYKLKATDLLPYITIGLIFLVVLALLIVKIRYGRNDPGKGIVVAQYLPPSDSTVLLSADIINAAHRAFAAQIVGFAVKGRIRIIEAQEKSLFKNNKKYTLELLNVDGLQPDEMSFIKILFGDLTIGRKYNISTIDLLVATQIRHLNKYVGEESEEQGYRHKRTTANIIKNILLVFLSLLSVGLVIEFMLTNNSIGLVIVFAAVFTLAVLFAIVSNTKGMQKRNAGITKLRPLTAKGRDLYDYLKGLKLFIKLTETKRLRVLQSPQGAEKAPIDTNDSAQIIKLYEKTLPYAILFNQEKQWAKQLGIYYENTHLNPLWYSGPYVFSADSFVSSISGFSNYSSIASNNSATSGLGGGGFSGGGGGGGGGGGR